MADPYRLPASFDVERFLADLRASDGEDQGEYNREAESELPSPFPPPIREREEDREDSAVIAAVCFGLLALGLVGLAIVRLFA
jgi:hypothetical protein